MRKRWEKYAIALIVVHIFFLFKTTAAPYPPITWLSIDQGLSNNSVRCIFQDHQGFMWFGTYDGLNRYNGYDFKIFRTKRKDTNSLVHNIVSAIAEDAGHYIWIGTRQGVSRYDNLMGSFTTINYTIKNKTVSQKLNAVVRDIKCDKSNNVFIGTEESGLLLCQKGVVTAIQVPILAQNNDITTYSVQAIQTDDKNRVWVIVQNRGLFLLDPQLGKLKPVAQFSMNIICMAITGGNIYLGSGNAVYDYSIAANNLQQVLAGGNGKLSQGDVVSLMPDKTGNLWIGMETGMVNIWNKASQHMDYLKPGDNKYSLAGGAIHSIYEDREGRKWIGTLRGGVNIVDPRKGRFQTITHEPGNNNSLTGNVISGIYEAPDSSLWIGTDGSGLNVWNRRNNSFTLYTHNPADPNSISDNFITCIKADHDQNIWIGTFEKGINRFNKTTHRFDHYSCINPASGAENRVVFSLYTDHAGTLWAGTLRQGGIYGALYRYNKSANRFDVFDAGLSDIFRLYEDKNGTLWGGNLNQLIQIDQVNHHHNFVYIGHTIRAFHEDAKGNFWIGTEGGGLLLFDRKKNAVAATYTTDEGLCNDVVLNILEDAQGNLWMSTYNGLSRFDPVQKKFTSYYQGDGLQSNQFYYNAALALRSGEMAFGGIKGLSLFNPSNIDNVKSMPSLLLTGLTVNGVPLQQKNTFITSASRDNIQSIKVPYNQAAFSFNFTALEYSSPDKIGYSYFMEGWDRNWNYAGNIRTALYTHLDEGHYTFHVKCANAEGVWNEKQILLDITVLPPWYRTWWAYMVYTLMLLGIVYVIFLYKVRQNRLEYEIKVAHLNAQQEKELYEKKMSFFTHVSHEFRTPLTLIINPIKEILGGKKDTDNEELKTVYRNARRLLSLVDQLLLFRKTESETDSMKIARLNFSHVCKEVYLCFAHQARIKKIDYRFECENESLFLYADREKIEITLFNLISNALKFTPQGGQVVFKISETNEVVQVNVTDTGYGIPDEVGDKLFGKFYRVKGSHTPSKGGFGIGLYLVKHFAESHAGTITYESTVGKGTDFVLTLLKGKNHFNGVPVYEDVEEESIFLHELAEDTVAEKAQTDLAVLVTEQQTILIIDDDAELRSYVSQVFADNFTIIEADNGNEGARLAQHYLPDIIISDITMQGINGIELCKMIKENPALSHIPVILLTASTASDTQLKGIESGADDYITKPFEKELLKARVLGILKKRNILQQYFYNEITLKKNDLKVSAEYKEFLDQCIRIVESHLDDDSFSIKTFAAEIGMSHSRLYKKVKSVSGQSIKGFIRFIRLRKAAELMINTEQNINEIATLLGFNDIKYFRQHFCNLFGMNPSEYVKKFRKPFHNTHQLNKKAVNRQ